MFEPNLGITAYCSICGRRFWCSDGYSICSSECDRILEMRQEDEEREREREEKIQFCIDSNNEFGAYPNNTDFEYMSDEELEECVEFLDYLWTK